jgi:hypothetical protein
MAKYHCGYRRILAISHLTTAICPNFIEGTSTLVTSPDLLPFKVPQLRNVLHSPQNFKVTAQRARTQQSVNRFLPMTIGGRAVF